MHPIAAVALRALFMLFKIVGVLFVLVFLYIIGGGRMPMSATRSMAHRTTADMRDVAHALEAYNLDNGAYPPMVPINVKSMTEAEQTRSGGKEITTWSTALRIDVQDLFSRAAGHSPFAYFTKGDGWIAYSAGPDGDYDIRPELLNQADLVLGEDAHAERDARLTALSYDPTNGSSSSGDIIRVHAIETRQR